MITLQSRAIHDPPRYDPENKDKINKMDLASYFEDLMKRREANPAGFINLPKENFKKMVEKAKTLKDLETLKYAHVNYLGHRNILPQSYVDLMMLKALEIGEPEIMFEVYHFHSELMYHPSTNVTKKYLDYIINTAKSYDLLKKFFEATKGNYTMLKPKSFYTSIIDQAFANKDPVTVV